MATLWGFMGWSLCSCILRMSYKLNGKNILKKNRNYLVCSNHIGSLDFMIINELFREAGMLPDMKYIVKYELRFVPIFYQLIFLMNFLIVKRNFEEDKKKIKEYLETMSKYRIPACLILYPEGSRFSEAKRNKCWEFCEKTGNVKLNNVLFPRFKGLELIGSSIDHTYMSDVADITLIHKTKEVPPLWKVLFTEIKGEVDFHIKVTPIKDIKNFKEFLLESFKRKDVLIEQKKEINKLLNF